MTRRIALVAGLYALLGGVVALAGWVLDVRRVTDWDNNGISIQPNATLCVIFSGLAVLALAANHRRFAVVGGAIVLSVGGLTLLQWVSGLSFGIDALLMFGRQWGRVGVVVPGRMGPPGSFSWTLIGMALIASAGPSRLRRLAPTLALATTAISSLSLIGYLYNADELFALPYFTIIALQTSTFIMAVSLGIIVLHPDREPMRTLLDPGSAGILARRILPVLIAAAVGLGFLRVKGQQAGLFDTAMGTAMLVLTLIVLLAVSLWLFLLAIRRREQSLKAQTELINSVNNNTGDLIFMKDVHGHLIYANAATLAVVRRSTTDITELDRNLFAVVAEHDAIRENDRRVRETGETIRVEEVYTSADGERRVYLSTKNPLRDTHGAIVGIIAVAQDVTERKQAEQSLREALADTQLLHRLAMSMAKSGEPHEFYERLMDAAVEIMQSDFASLQVLRPERGERGGIGELELMAFRGFTPQAAELWKWVRPDSHSACAVALRTGQRCDIPDGLNDSRIAGEDRAAFAQTGIRAVQTTPLMSRTGRLLGAISTHWRSPRDPQTVTERDWRMLDVLARHAADLVERMQAEATVRRNAETFSALVEQSPLGIYTVDSEFRIRNVSKGAMLAFRNVKPLIGRDFAEVMRVIWPESFASEAIAIFRRTLETGERYVSPGLTEKRHDIAAVESYEWQTDRVTLDDGKYGVVCYYFDSTRLQQAQQALRDTDRRKDEFLATLAHELRNPLAPVRNAVQVLHMKGPAVPELQWARDVIDRQMQQMTRLIDDLMDISRINQGKIELKRERAALATLIQGAVETSRPLIEQCGHELTVDLPPQPLHLDADVTRLAQVFANLLNNAAKYTERGGVIKLTAERQGSDVVVFVKDSGIGIPRDKLRSVFEMFAQVQGALERSQGGLGIGLSLVKRLVEMHGGTIEAHSEGPGKGSEFVVRLPIVIDQTRAAIRRGSDEQEAPASSLRILIVDDNRDGADSLGLMLRLVGNEVHTAYDGETAVRAAGEHRPQVVLLDIGLPKLNGYDVCRSIRQEPWSQHTVIIAMTGWGQDDDKQKAKDAGFDQHLVKPVDPGGLMKLLGSLPKRPTC